MVLIKNIDGGDNDVFRYACTIDVWSIPGLVITGGVSSETVVAVYNTSVTYH